MKKTTAEQSGGEPDWSLPPEEFGLKVLLPLAAILIVCVLLYGGWTLLH